MKKFKLAEKVLIGFVIMTCLLFVASFFFLEFGGLLFKGSSI